MGLKILQGLSKKLDPCFLDKFNIFESKTYF
jgi:hypothetical protein